MGSGIAEVSARAGLDVVVVESGAAAAATARARLEGSLGRAQKRGKIGDVAEVLGRITISTRLDDLADRQIVIEAIAEQERAKVELFALLDKIVSAPEALLASNTSSIPIMKLGVATERPAQVIGIHFFNPVPVLPLVELVPSLLTSTKTRERSRQFVERVLGKHAITSQDRAGFIVNSLLIPFILSAIRMLESGFATAEDIDQGLVLGAAHLQGPSPSQTSSVSTPPRPWPSPSMTSSKEPLYASPPLLNRMVDAGLLGRKAGRGFYTYPLSSPGGRK